MQQGRATATRSRTTGPTTQRGRSGSFDGHRRTAIADPVALAVAGTEPTMDDLLDLQREAGNQAVTSLVATLRPVQRQPTATVTEPETAEPAPPGQAPPKRLPHDVNLGFNAMDVAHRLIESIDQSEKKIVKKGDPGYVEGVVLVVRHIDFPAVHGHLSGLTRAQVQEVEQQYSAYEKKRTLYNDLFRGGESNALTDLTVEQMYRLKALLAGTRASSEQDAEAAARNQREADVAELRGILKGKPSAGDAQRVMTLLRRPQEELELFVNAYNANWDLHGDIWSLGWSGARRAKRLIKGDIVEADAEEIRRRRNLVAGIDDQIKALQPPKITTELTAENLLNVALTVGESVTPTAAYQRQASIDALKSQRKAHVQVIEEMIKLVADEARQDAEAQGKDFFETDMQIRRSVEQIIGPVGELERVVGGQSALLISAVRRVDPSEQLAAELRRLYDDGKLTTDILLQSFRGLRQQAEEEAQRQNPEATSEELTEATRKLSDQWFIHLQTTWDASVTGDQRTFSQLLDKGDQKEVDVKRGLYMASGKLSDIDELVYALAGDRKDMETVKRVLREKSADEIMKLRFEYGEKTKSPEWPNGRSLDFALFGVGPTKKGEKVVRDRWGNVVGYQGKAGESDRLLLEDYMQRPKVEGDLREVEYVADRAEREYEYTMENRGVTGWWRDHWGNEAKSLLLATLKEVRFLKGRYLNLTNYGQDSEAVKSAAAHDLIHQMHLARATIRGDRAGYEKATAALRATFQAIASFVLQAVLTAVLAPFASALFAARLAHLAASASRIARMTAQFANWTKNTAVSMASTIGANKASYGNDYDTDMLLRDLRGGLGGAIGASAVGGMLGPVAGRLQDRLGKKMGGEVIAGAKTYGGMQATSMIEGEGAVTFEGFLQEHFLGKVGEGITGATSRGLGIGPGPTHAPYDPDAPVRSKAGAAGAEGEGGAATKPGEAATEPDVESEVYIPPRTPMALEPTPPAPKSKRAGRGRRAADTDVVESSKSNAEPGPAERSEAGNTRPGSDTDPGSPEDVGDVTDVDIVPPSGPEGTEVDIVPAGRARPEPRRPVRITTKSGRENRREQERRAEVFNKDEASLRASTGIDARARSSAGSFVEPRARWRPDAPDANLNLVRTAINQQLSAAGLPPLTISMSPDVIHGEASFNPYTFEITLSAESFGLANPTPEQYARLIESASHEMRHALHHFRGVRAALMRGQFDYTARIPPIVVDFATAANDGTARAEPLDRDTPAADEAFEIYDITHGETKSERRTVIQARDAAYAERVAARAARREARRAHGVGSPEYRDADRRLHTAQDAYDVAHNDYTKLPQETDAWRRGIATGKAVQERLVLQQRYEQGQRIQARAVERVRQAREGMSKARSQPGGDPDKAMAEFQAAVTKAKQLDALVKRLKRQLDRMAMGQPP